MSAPRPRRVTITKVLRLLLADDADTWQIVRMLDEETKDAVAEQREPFSGIAETVRLAVNLLRRAHFDNVAAHELLERVDGKLAPVYALPDDDDQVRTVSPVLYVAPDRPELTTGLFELLDASQPPPKGWQPPADEKTPN